MKFRRSMILAGLALAVPFLVPTVGTADNHEPTLYVSSTSGGNVDGVWFADEDILAHDLVNGGWERYFDGSDVGLRGNDLNAFHILDDGTILMALKKPQRIGGFWADDSDVIAFFPTSLGKQTAGTFEKVFDGSDVGLSTYAEEIDAIAVTPDERLLLSTSGPLKVPRTGGGYLWGADEDLIAFDAESFGPDTAGSFERYFDGSDVGLRSSSEDVWGVWVDPFSGEIVMTTKGYYRVPGLSGDKEDVIVFSPDSLGYRTTGTFSPGWDGDDHGLSGEYIDGLSVDPGQPPEEDQWFQASLNGDWVQGWGYQPGTSVAVRILAGPGGEELFSGAAPVDGDGYFYLDREEHGVDLMPGTYVEVDGRSLEMEELSFDVFDPDTEMIGGMAPAGATVGFGVGNEGDGRDGEVVATGGVWSVDLSADPYSFDLTGDMGGQAWISDDDGDQTVAEPPPPPAFQASLTNDWVQGCGFTPGNSVAAEIFESEGGASLFDVSAPTDGDGCFNVGDLEGLDLMPGMYITVVDPMLPPRALVLEDLTFDMFDPNTEMIGGTATAGATVGFGVGNEDGGTGGEVMATDGTWSVDLSADPYFFDLTGAMGGQAWISDDDGDQTIAEPRIPQFQASLTSNWVSGWNFTPDSSVDVEIFDVFGGTSQFTASAPTDGQGNFNVDDLSGVDLMPGMYVTVADPVLPLRELVLEPITFDMFDPNTEMIGGTATAGATVGFGVGNEESDTGGEVMATDGTWSVDLSADPYFFDLTGAMGGQAWISDDDGDQTVAEPRFVQFQASLTNNWVQGCNFTPDNSVMVEILDGVGGPSLFTASAPTAGDGCFNVHDVSGLDLLPGMYITVDDVNDAYDKDLVLEPITFDVFDFLTDTIGGMAPNDATVQFDVGTEFNGVGGQVTADGSGSWSVDLSAAAYNFDLTGAMGGQARVSDADGDQTVAEPRFAQFQASLTGNWVSGWNFTPGSPVTVEVFMSSTDPVALFTYDGVTDSHGNFNLDDLSGLDLIPDMYITVDDVVADNDKALTLAPLTFVEFDASSNLLAGEAPVGTLVVFGVGSEFGGIGGEVTAGGSGYWSVNTNTEQFGFFDLLPSMGNGQAWVFDDDGDQTVADLQVPQFQASLTGDWLQGWNFTPNSLVTVEVYEDLVGQFPGTQLFPPPDPPAPDPITTGDDGSFGLDLEQYGVNLVAGNYIVVTVDGTMKTLVAVALTFETFDVDANVIGGTADPGAYVEFGVGDDFDGLGGLAIADGTTGEWSVDLSADPYGFDLTDTMGGQAWVSDFDLDQTVAEPPPPET